MSNLLVLVHVSKPPRSAPCSSKLFIVLCDLLPYRNQSSLEAEGVLLRSRVLGELGGDASPITENGNRVGVDLAVGLADSGEVDLADKVNNGGLLGVVGAALHLEFVDAILVVALRNTNDKVSSGFLPGAMSGEHT